VGKEIVIFTYKMEYFSALKREEVQQFTLVQMKLKDITLNEISQTQERQIVHTITYI
jgi:hypothetical protein